MTQPLWQIPNVNRVFIRSLELGGMCIAIVKLLW